MSSLLPQSPTLIREFDNHVGAIQHNIDCPRRIAGDIPHPAGAFQDHFLMDHAPFGDDQTSEFLMRQRTDEEIVPPKWKLFPSTETRSADRYRRNPVERWRFGPW
jgi:hypothetical protein